MTAPTGETPPGIVIAREEARAGLEGCARGRR
jgi:hypothetical protein